MAATPTKADAAPTQQQQFCVRWNSYQSNLQNAFPKLLTSEHFVDVTLACEAEMIKCHKVVLSACSTYFEKLLVQNPCQHPIIFMKDMRFSEMQALVDFMYKGEVNVTQDELPSLLRSAEALQIRGLCGSDQLLSQHLANNTTTSTTTSQQQQTQQHHIGNVKKEHSTESIPNACSTPVVNGQELSHHHLQMQRRESTNGDAKRADTPSSHAENGAIKRRDSLSSNMTPASPDDDSERGLSIVEPQLSIKEDLYENDDSYYDNDDGMMDSEYLDQDEEDPNQPGTSASLSFGPVETKPVPDYAMANVSCQYNDGSPGGGIPSARRIRRSEAELRRAAECITRGQTFQTVSDQFNIPISTIRFYMARKGILPRRKRGRACSAPGSNLMSQSMGSMGIGHGTPLSSNSGFHNAPGNTSPVGPPYHIVHYKLPALGAKLK